jgi:hypothetical protein
MKRILILSAFSLLSYECVLASSFESTVDKRTSVLLIDDAYTIHACNIEVMPVIVPELFSPKLVSNFNRLVVFGELGSCSVADVVLSVIRGPPKIHLS